MRQTVVGVFDRQETARDAVEALRCAGFDRARIHVTDSHPGATASVVAAAPAREDDGVMGHVRSFLAEVFGVDHDLTPHAEAVRGGGAVVKVDVDERVQVPRAELALLKAGAVDITHRSGDLAPPASSTHLASGGDVPQGKP